MAGTENSPRQYDDGVEPVPAEGRGWQLAKFILNALLLLTSTAGLGLGLSFVRYPQESFVILLVAGCSTVFGIGFICSGAEFLHRLIRKDSISPAILIPLYILSAAACLVFGGWVVWLEYDYNTDPFYYNSILDMNNSGTYAYDVQIAAFAFLVASFVVSVILFVGACADTYSRLKRRTAQSKTAERPGWVQGPLPQIQHSPTYFFQDDNSEHLGEVSCDEDEPEMTRNEKAPAKPKKAYSA